MLTDRIFSAEARKPFRRYSKPATISDLRAVVYDVRTLVRSKDEGFQKMLAWMHEALRPEEDDLSVAA